MNCGLTSGRLSQPRGQHTAHKHFVDLIRAKLSPVDRFLDRDSAQCCCTLPLERALKTSDRCSYRTGDNDRIFCFRHLFTPPVKHSDNSIAEAVKTA